MQQYANLMQGTFIDNIAIISTSLSISIASRALMVWDCHLDHLSVGLSVQSYPDDVWDGEWGQSRDGCIRWGGDRRRGRGSFCW